MRIPPEQQTPENTDIPCNPKYCEIARKLGAKACFADTHHVYYPACDYKTKVEKRFRQRHQLVMCRAVHDAIHATVFKSKKPAREEMLGHITTN